MDPVEEIAYLEGLHDSKNFAEIAKYLQGVIEGDNKREGADQNPELLWRYARAKFDVAGEIDPKKNKTEHETLLLEGRTLAEKAVQLSPDNWACNKWLAILMSTQGDYLPMKQRITEAFEVKQFAFKAHELNPEDPTILHFLGRFAFRIAGISWVERKIAATVMAEPPKTTYEEALDYFLKADKASSSPFIRNWLWIGHTHAKLGNKAEAKEYYQKTADAQPETQSDQFEIDEAKQLLKKL